MGATGLTPLFPCVRGDLRGKYGQRPAPDAQASGAGHEGLVSGVVAIRVNLKEHAVSADQRKERLENLLHLARVMRGWSRAKLARALDRDPTKILPASGNPKADYLIKLADVLEWPVGDVIDAIWRGGFTGSSTGEPTSDATFKEIATLVTEAVSRADYHEVVRLSQDMYTIAKTGDERAHAAIREAAGWDGLGRYPKVLECAQRGLHQGTLSLRLRLALQATMAHAEYTLWDLTPALGTSEVLVNWYAANPPERGVDAKRVAFVHYVRGNTRRRLMAVEPENKRAHCEGAREDLRKAIEIYNSIDDPRSQGAVDGFVRTCEGGLLELGVELGDIRPASALETILASLPETESLKSDELLESHGWWCVFGSNIALRHLHGRELQKPLRAMMAKALEVADRLDNWAMRERVFTMQFTFHEMMSDASGYDIDYTIDDQERSLITATMGRFPSFRPVGWQILETARVVNAG